MKILEIHNENITHSEYLTVLSEIYMNASNGKIIFKQFKLSLDNNESIAIQSDKTSFIYALFNDENVKKSFENSQLMYSNVEIEDLNKLNLKKLSNYLKSVAVNGGAYGDRQKYTNEYLSVIVSDFLKNIAEAEENKFQFFRKNNSSLYLHTNHAWTEWFYDIAWDSTFIIFDEKNMIVSILLITDTD